MDNITKGEIYEISRTDDYGIHSIRKPFLIVSSILVNDLDDYVNAVPVLETEAKGLPTHVKIRVNAKECVAACEKIMRIPKKCLLENLGQATQKELAEINKRLAVTLEVSGAIKSGSDFIKAYEKEYKKSERKEQEQLKRALERELKEQKKSLLAVMKKADTEKDGEIESLSQRVEQICRERDELKEALGKAYQKEEVDQMIEEAVQKAAEKKKSGISPVELSVLTEERDNYRAKYIELLKKMNP